MPRRTVTLARAFALLLAGIGIGASIFLAKRLRPEALKAEVERAIRELVAGSFDVREVILDLDRGVELVQVTLRYPDGRPALEAERVSIAVDQRQLLAGEVEIRQIDLRGAKLWIRGHDGTAWRNPLEGILQPREDTPLPKDFRLPVIRVRPGSGPSTLELEGSGALDRKTPLRCTIVRLDAYPDGADYRLLAEFKADRIDRARLEASVRPREGTAEGSLRIDAFRFERSDRDLLAPEVRASLPPVELGGTAQIEMKASARLAPFALTDTRLFAALSQLDGAFGNLHTGETEGLPFGLAEGTATLSYRDGHLTLPDLRAEFVSPEGVRGAIGVAIEMDFARPGSEVDFTLRGRGVRASTEDLHLLLEPGIVESIVEPYRPAGTFDFEITVSRRLGLPEKVTADLRLREGAFNYAGKLDELTGRRFGFHYPLERCSGHILIETNVPTPRGLAQITQIRDIQGYNRISRPRPGGAKEVRIEAEGRTIAYETPGEETRRMWPSAFSSTTCPSTASSPPPSPRRRMGCPTNNST
ncbi:MAG: hypothetical protein HC813_01455 [Planctomycetes bacterium]|nr:hypothetical protein [Planctomycetota bacterium]